MVTQVADQFNTLAQGVTGAGTFDNFNLTTGAAATPNSVTGLTATARDGAAVVRWSPGLENPAAPVTGYRVVADNSTYALTYQLDTVTAVTLLGLANSVAWTVTVYALAGDVASTGSVITVTPTAASPAFDPAQDPASALPVANLPDPPGDVVTMAGDGEGLVAWSEPAGNGAPVDSYLVTLDDGVTPVTFATTVPFYSLTGLVNSTVYQVTVRALNEVGTGPASTAVQLVPLAGLPSIGDPSGPPAPPALLPQPTYMAFQQYEPATPDHWLLSISTEAN